MRYLITATSVGFEFSEHQLEELKKIHEDIKFQEEPVIPSGSDKYYHVFVDIDNITDLYKFGKIVFGDCQYINSVLVPTIELYDTWRE